MEIKNGGEALKPIIPVGLAFIGLGLLSMFCNPDLVRQHLDPQYQQVFDQAMGGECNESYKFVQNMTGLPDGCERQVAGMLNYALRRRWGRKRGKPHHVLTRVVHEATGALSR